MKKIVILSVVLALSGCGAMQRLGLVPAAAVPEVAVPEAAVPVTATPMGASGATAAALDTTTAAEKAVALATPATGGERELGRVVVALGPPAEQGLWVRTALVTAVGKGRVVTAAGATLAVELRPGTGGALLSLAAFQALGLKLTDLPEVTVYGP